jgi:ribosomal protein S18 acetylase RimI-like enzyme
MLEKLDVTVRPYTPTDGAAVMDLQQRYAARYPGAAVVGAEIYAHPGFEGGRNILCAIDNGGMLLGYAPLFPGAVDADADADLPHRLWAALKPDPDLAAGAAEEVADILMERLLARAAEVAAALSPRRTELTFEYVATEEPAIAHALAHGFTRVAGVYAMSRDLAEPIPTVPAPVGIDAREWRMDSPDERRTYLEARNAAFPESPWAPEGLDYFLGSPHWAVGTTCAAFGGDRLVGNVLVYWDPHQTGERRMGYTEEIFTLAPWRGRGIARCLIVRGLEYLRAHGLHEAHLQVRATNEGALGLYTSLGYRVITETLHLAREV